MIKIFGRQPFFVFHHIIYEYKVSEKNNKQKLMVEKITDNINEADMGYFSMRMLKKVLVKNKNKSEGYLFKNENGSSVIGFAIICYRGAKEMHYRIKNADAYISALGVFPAFQGKGYSQIILNLINSICFEKGFESLKLAVDNNNYIAIKSYEKFGFKRSESKKFIRMLGIDLLIKKTI